jgi:hypothetical protein
MPTQNCFVESFNGKFREELARVNGGRVGARDRVRTGDPQLGNVTEAVKQLWFLSQEWI